MIAPTLRNVKEGALESDESHCVVTMEVSSQGQIQIPRLPEATFCGSYSLVGTSFPLTAYPTAIIVLSGFNGRYSVCPTKL